MQELSESPTDHLVQLAAAGDAPARTELLTRHRPRLRQLVSRRIDGRLAARLDPSDVVQETLLEAARRMSDFLSRQPMPFYEWLQRLAAQKLADLHRQHVLAQRRSVRREDDRGRRGSDPASVALADRLIDSISSPSQSLHRKELQALVQTALSKLQSHDREVLLLRHVEHLSAADTAAVLGLTVHAVRTGQRRALEQLTLSLTELWEDR